MPGAAGASAAAAAEEEEGGGGRARAAAAAAARAALPIADSPRGDGVSKRLLSGPGDGKDGMASSPGKVEPTEAAAGQRAA